MMSTGRAFVAACQLGAPLLQWHALTNDRPCSVAMRDEEPLDRTMVIKFSHEVRHRTYFSHSFLALGPLVNILAGEIMKRTELWLSCRQIPTDYVDFGGKIERDESEHFPDCSDCGVGCKWFAALDGLLGGGFGVCCSRASPRSGLLTAEHQAGFGCFARRGQHFDCN